MTRRRRNTILILAVIFALAAAAAVMLYNREPAPEEGAQGNATQIPVLAYHNITDQIGRPETGLTVTKFAFNRQMKYLHDNGFKTLTLDEFRQWHDGEIEVPAKSVVITFDDGYAGTYYFAYPIIRKYGQAAAVFCVGKMIREKTDRFDRNDPFSCYVGKDAIEEVRRDYPAFQFESHTYDMHSRIDGRKPLNVLSDEEILEDFQKCEELGFRYLAYPWGASNKAMRKAAKKCGIEMAFGYRPFVYATRDDKTYNVNRIKIDSGMNMRFFRDIVNCRADEESLKGW